MPKRPENNNLPPGLTVRSLPRSPWFRMDNNIIDSFAEIIGGVGVAVYMGLARHADPKTQECWPSLAYLSKHLGCSPSLIQEHLDVLQAVGLIAIEQRPGRGTIYTLL